MINQRIKLLLEKYLLNTLTEMEKDELLIEMENSSDEELWHILNTIDTPDDYVPEIAEQDINDRLDTIKGSLFERGKIGPVEEQKEISKRIPWNRMWKVAAAACALLIGLGWYWWPQQQQDEPRLVMRDADIAPATPVALITLENGETIHVDSTATGLIYSKDGLNVYKSAEGEIVYRDSSGQDATPSYLTVHTPKGGFTKLKLDDGTVVELNAASSIRYPTSFEKDKRDVFVEGEAFFDVQRDKDRPFRVHSQRQIIEVLGTSFNLISGEQYAKTTLIEGSVKIVSEGKDYFLKPGQQAVVSDKVEIKDVNTAGPVAWKNEKFIFDNSSFKETLKEVENWYDVQMVFFDQDLDHVQLSGTVSRNVKLSELLKVLEMNTNYKFEIKGRRVLVRRD